MRAPFRLDLTANVLRRLSTNAVDAFDGVVYRRLVGDAGAPTLLAVAQRAPELLTATLVGPAADRLDAAVLLERLLGTQRDVGAFVRRAGVFPWLGRLATAALGVKPPRYPSLWESCVNAIVYQQVSIHAAGAILRRTIERYTEPRPIDAQTVLHPFPGPQTLLDADPEELRGVGLSVNKVVSLRAVARAIVDGTLDEAGLDLLPTPELTAALVEHRGIGPWTAAVIALRGFGRLDLFPMNDSGAARGLKEFSGEADLDLEALLAHLGDQRGMLYYHLLLARLAKRGEVALPASEPAATELGL